MRFRVACIVFAVAALVASPAWATVTVNFDPENAVITDVGLTTDVDLVADFSDAIVAWGLELDIASPTIATQITGPRAVTRRPNEGIIGYFSAPYRLSILSKYASQLSAFSWRKARAPSQSSGRL